MWTIDGPPGAQTVLNGRSYLYFAGTGYLGLQGHPALAAAACAAAEQYGLHPATTRSGFGTCPPVRDVEVRSARFLASDDACYLATGYAGNFAVAAALSGSVELVLIDESAHDCLREATRWLDDLQLPPLVFRHCDAGHVEELLRSRLRSGWRALLLTDGVFAAGGRLAPLADYISVLGKYPGAMLHVDDAHGLGVLGAGGRGSLEHWGVGAEHINRDLAEPLDGVRILQCGTLSKAVGGHGGIIAGSRALLDRVRNASGWFRGSSAPAAPVAAATAKGLEIVEAQPALRQQLAKNVMSLRAALRARGFDVAPSPSPIIGLSLSSAAETDRVHGHLLDQGIAIGLARDYAGAGPTGILRIAVFATHTQEMLDRLVESLAGAM